MWRQLTPKVLLPTLDPTGHTAGSTGLEEETLMTGTSRVEAGSDAILVELLRLGGRLLTSVWLSDD